VKKDKFYVLTATMVCLGHAWLLINYLELVDRTDIVSVCMLKFITNLPCPSCGTTRAVISIFDGNLLDSVFLNPNGLVVLFVMTVVPILLTFDCVLQKDTLFLAYLKTERILKQKGTAIPVTMLVLVNWGWNIYKDL
jgi:hypothetical protein